MAEDSGCEIGVLVDLNSPEVSVGPSVPLNLMKRQNPVADEDDPWGIFPSNGSKSKEDNWKNDMKIPELEKDNVFDKDVQAKSSETAQAVKASSELQWAELQAKMSVCSDLDSDPDLDAETFPSCNALEEENDLLFRCRSIVEKAKRAVDENKTPSLSAYEEKQLERDALLVVKSITDSSSVVSIQSCLSKLHLEQAGSKPEGMSADTPFKRVYRLHFSSESEDEKKSSPELGLSKTVETPRRLGKVVSSQQCEPVLSEFVAPTVNTKIQRSHSLVKSKTPAKILSRGPLRATMPAHQMVKDSFKGGKTAPVKQAMQFTTPVRRSSSCNPELSGRGKSESLKMQSLRRSITSLGSQSSTSPKNVTPMLRKKLVSCDNRNGNSIQQENATVNRKPRRHSAIPKSSGGSAVKPRYSALRSNGINVTQGYGTPTAKPKESTTPLVSNVLKKFRELKTAK